MGATTQRDKGLGAREGGRAARERAETGDEIERERAAVQEKTAVEEEARERGRQKGTAREGGTSKHLNSEQFKS